MTDRATFESWRSFSIFENEILRRSRHFFSETTNKFFRAVLSTSNDRRHVIPAGRHFWRAQIGHEWIQLEGDDEDNEQLSAVGIERMKPLLHRATEGRANPKGIPCLYLATDKETAMSEVRPGRGDLISVGQFRLLNDVSIIDCSRLHAKGFTFYFEEPGPGERERAVWADIDRSFAIPKASSIDTADYSPTQILAELFKANEFDGIVYKSSLGPKFNLALFDTTRADLVNCFLYEATEVSYSFKEAANPYYMSKYIRK